MSNLTKIDQYFLDNPSRLEMGANKISSRTHIPIEEVKASRKKVRALISMMEKAETVGKDNYIAELEEHIVEISNEKGTLKSTTSSTFDPKSDIELAKLHKIDLDKYKITSYWSKLKPNGNFNSSVLCVLRKITDEDKFQEDFLGFLKEFEPSPVIIKNNYTSNKPKIALLLPKQDAHYNKYDIMGDNNIDKRFSIEQKSVLSMLEKANSTNSIDEVIYIVGSDQFNSEWTNLTTKGTPQQNILTYQESFSAICNHEIEIVTTLLHYSNKVRIVFIPGNHDEFVGWHLINFLESYFRENKDCVFDSSTLNTKYYKYGNSAIMLNHGDDIKPKDLAHIFPMGFKEDWSLCNNHYVFTGDKHTELSLDIHGIKFYRIPQLSSAKSKWDDKKGFTESKAEMTAFVLTLDNGMSDIYKNIL